LSKFSNVVTEEAVRTSGGMLFHAMGPAMQNAWLPEAPFMQ